VETATGISSMQSSAVLLDKRCSQPHIIIIMPPHLGQGALSDDAHLTSVCLTSVCHVHRA